MTAIEIRIDVNDELPNLKMDNGDDEFILTINKNKICFHRVCSLLKGDNCSVKLCVKYDGDIFIYTFVLEFDTYIYQDDDLLERFDKLIFF